MTAASYCYSYACAYADLFLLLVPLVPLFPLLLPRPCEMDGVDLPCWNSGAWLGGSQVGVSQDMRGSFSIIFLDCALR